MRLILEHSVREFTAMPGCSQAVVSHSMFMRLKFRNQGLAVAELQRALAHASALGYDYYICTVDRGNIPQVKVLCKAGFKELDWFTSQKTGHNVVFYGKCL